MPEAWEIACSVGGFKFGLGNLLSLQYVLVRLLSGVGASMEEVQEAKALVRHAAEIHPNRPKLDIYCVDEGV